MASCRILISSILLAFLQFSWPAPADAIAADLTGPVVSVLNGETIKVDHNQQPERSRLHEIDCPEKAQTSGKRAKHATEDLTLDKEVRLQTHGHDKYRRTIADILLPDGTNINCTLVKESWCWWYRKYAPGDLAREGFERETRDANKGLRVDPAHVPPWG